MFEKLSLFEIHLEDAQFGPKSLVGSRESDDGSETTDDEMETAEGMDDEMEASTSRRGGRKFLALVAVSTAFAVGATLLARRTAGDDETADDEMTADEDVEVEITDEAEVDEPVA